MNTIAAISILTDDVPRLTTFYRSAFGLVTTTELDGYTEFAMDGVRFEISARRELIKATHHPSYQAKPSGQSFELAFELKTPAEVDKKYAEIIKKSATPVTPPADMPWGQRTAFFADPDGNIHELFAELPKT